MASMILLYSDPTIPPPSQYC